MTMAQALARRFTKLSTGVLASAETFHFAVRVSRRAATLRFGTLDVASVVRGAISHAAFDIPILVSRRSAALPGTQHLAVLIRGTLPFSARDISIRIFDAIRRMSRTPADQQDDATDKECSVHEVL